MKASLLKEEFKTNKYDEMLKDLYEDASLVDYQKDRYANALDKFVELYGDENVSIYSAAGRSEISGNHTDHQHGCVLAGSINLDAIGVVARQDDVINVVSDSFNIKPIYLNDLDKKDEEEGTSEGLIRGVVSKLKELGYNIGGFKAFITSDVLVGAGLSRASQPRPDRGAEDDFADRADLRVHVRPAQPRAADHAGPVPDFWAGGYGLALLSHRVLRHHLPCQRRQPDRRSGRPVHRRDLRVDDRISAGRQSAGLCTCFADRRCHSGCLCGLSGLELLPGQGLYGRHRQHVLRRHRYGAGLCDAAPRAGALFRHCLHLGRDDRRHPAHVF